MAPRVCPSCRSQYVASVRRCIDCDVMLDDDSTSGEEAPASVATPIGEGDQIAYELDGWGSQLKVTLEGMLDKAAIRRAWEAGALVVPAAFEAEVDALVATVEGGDVIELEAADAQIAFETAALTPDELDDLDARLISAQIAHGYEDGGDLLVSEADEDVVTEMIQAVLDGEGADGDDGLATLEALTDLYVAVDKAVKDPFDAKLVARYSQAAAPVDSLGVPYGLAAGEWKQLVEQVDAVGVTLAAGPNVGPTESEDDVAADDDAPGDDDETRPLTAVQGAEQALRELRDRLRELV